MVSEVNNGEIHPPESFGNVSDVAEAMENMIVLQRMQNVANATKEDILL